jgi:hypothetical protein
VRDRMQANGPPFEARECRSLTALVRRGNAGAGLLRNFASMRLISIIASRQARSGRPIAGSPDLDHRNELSVLRIAPTNCGRGAHLTGTMGQRFRFQRHHSPLAALAQPRGNRSSRPPRDGQGDKHAFKKMLKKLYNSLQRMLPSL